MVDAKHVTQHLDEEKPEGVVNEAVQQVGGAGACARVFDMTRGTGVRRAGMELGAGLRGRRPCGLKMVAGAGRTAW